MTSPITFFGIRHHGPGCARSLRKAFDALNPDCVLIEGPAGCEPLLHHLDDSAMRPPVALLSYSSDNPQLAVFHPYVVFSPEWQAMLWARQAGSPVHFIDLPPDISLARARAQEEKACAEGEETFSETETETESSSVVDIHLPRDPLDWLARAAGYSDGENWWNHMVEERGDGEGLFEAIAEAMTVLREETPSRSEDPEREEMREAHMRLAIRDAVKAGHGRIAVVCGAWHVPALARNVTQAADKAILKNVPKLKAQTTWVPWTYRHLTIGSGYAAGIASPGWYEYLWRSGQGETRAVGWFAHVARLLREHDLDCSSAHLIEATRLADTLAALRNRPAPGLAELNEAALGIICNGDDAPMRLIAEQLMIGQVLGGVPPSVPTVPLQRDLEAQQRTLRLKPETLERTLDLDLRREIDLRRSQLLHRLALLDIHWGRLSRAGASSKGTFHELWQLAWEPGFEVDIITASRYGHTLENAATACARTKAAEAKQLADLTALIDKVLLASLPEAVAPVVRELEARTAGNADPLALLDALPALANVHRYGNVRQTDTGLVAHLFDSMLLHACIGLPLACGAMDDEAAEAVRSTLLSADRAVALRNADEQTDIWHHALHVIADSAGSASLLRGACCRLLLDAGVYAVDTVQRLIGLNLSPGTEPLDAARWLDGFLNRNAAVLLHGDLLWELIDEWLNALSDEHFLKVVPLVRRTFAEFEAADRRDLAQKVKQGPSAAKPATAASDWNEERAQRALDSLREILGLP